MWYFLETYSVWSRCLTSLDASNNGIDSHTIYLVEDFAYHTGLEPHEVRTDGRLEEIRLAIMGAAAESVTVKLTSSSSITGNRVNVKDEESTKAELQVYPLKLYS
jgi:hypothetical protein